MSLTECSRVIPAVFHCRSPETPGESADGLHHCHAAEDTRAVRDYKQTLTLYEAEDITFTWCSEWLLGGY